MPKAILSVDDGQLFQICGGNSSGRDSGVISLGRLDVSLIISMQYPVLGVVTYFSWPCSHLRLEALAQPGLPKNTS